MFLPIRTFLSPVQPLNAFFAIDPCPEMETDSKWGIEPNALALSVASASRSFNETRDVQPLKTLVPKYQIRFFPGQRKKELRIPQTRDRISALC